MRLPVYVGKVFAPTLKPGDSVIMENLGSRKGKAVRRADAVAFKALCMLRFAGVPDGRIWLTDGQTLRRFPARHAALFVNVDRISRVATAIRENS